MIHDCHWLSLIVNVTLLCSPLFTQSQPWKNKDLIVVKPNTDISSLFRDIFLAVSVLFQAQSSYSPFCLIGGIPFKLSGVDIIVISLAIYLTDLRISPQFQPCPASGIQSDLSSAPINHAVDAPDLYQSADGTRTYSTWSTPILWLWNCHTFCCDVWPKLSALLDEQGYHLLSFAEVLKIRRVETPAETAISQVASHRIRKNVEVNYQGSFVDACPPWRDKRRPTDQLMVSLTKFETPELWYVTYEYIWYVVMTCHLKFTTFQDFQVMVDLVTNVTKDD